MFSVSTHPWWRRWFGARSERAAASFLRRLGYRILVHNFTCEIGEIDIIAVDGRTIVFVEVRSTGADHADQAARSVDATKQRKLTKLARHYLQVKRLTGCSARFDVLAISWPATKKDPAITHYPNAFEAMDS